MTAEELDAIEEAYETRIGPDATTVRILIDGVRALQEELYCIDLALMGMHKPKDNDTSRAAEVAKLVSFTNYA